MQDLVNKLNSATKAYDEGRPIMPDEEWDNLYFQLQEMERKSGKILPDSPTHNISYQVVSSLRKVAHNHPMLSLAKTKDLDEIKKFCGKNQEIISMNKLDGLTCSLRYLNGKLVAAETRGNGAVGEDILHNALVIPSIPKHIHYTQELIIDGEIICKYSDFEQYAELYKNPRNFAAGSIRLLDNQECQKRNLTFVAWEVIKGLEELNRLSERLNYIKTFCGFITVPYLVINEVDNECVNLLQEQAIKESYPIDGLVFKFDNIDYGRTLGSTAHHNNNAIAFKFYDDVYPTTLIDIDWTMGRSGQLTPVAVFVPVEIDGTEVSRASMHNLHIMYDTLGEIWQGRPIKIYKSNLIIPQVLKDTCQNTDHIPNIPIPTKCPICGTELKQTEDNLICVNPECEGQYLNQLDHFCGKKGLDIRGLSKNTLEKLLDWNWVNSYADIFKLKQHREEWIQKAGFGEKSVDNLLAAIETAKNTTLEKFISAIGIPLIGQTVARELIKYVKSYQDFRDKIKNKFDFTKIDGFAENKTYNLLKFDYKEADEVEQFLNISVPLIEENNNASLKDKAIVITGSLKNFKNRSEFQKEIEKCGGKVTSSVTKNTSILVNNDINSTSSKNTAAKKLNIPILTEEDFVKKYLTF